MSACSAALLLLLLLAAGREDAVASDSCTAACGGCEVSSGEEGRAGVCSWADGEPGSWRGKAGGDATGAVMAGMSGRSCSCCRPSAMLGLRGAAWPGLLSWLLLRRCTRRGCCRSAPTTLLLRDALPLAGSSRMSAAPLSRLCTLADTLLEGLGPCGGAGEAAAERLHEAPGEGVSRG